MNAFQGFITRMMGRILGLKGEAHIVFIQFDNDDLEPTINDIVKNNEEDAINSVRQQTTNRMESGE
jgi:hypothetical protein